MQLWVGLLGPFEVRWAGERVALAGAKQRALFAMLALRANAPISVDELVERVWSSSSPRRPTKTVQVHVARLRAALGEAASCVVTTPTGYLLRVDEEQVDLTRFERLLVAGQAALTEGDPQGAGDELAAALALWRGAPLADFAHEEFAQEEIRRVEELRLSALEARVEADLQLGRHGVVVAELDALVREHPLRERLHAQRMLALYRCGRQAEALDAFQRARRVLVEQIGVEPGPELRRLHEAILHHDPSLGPPADRTVKRPSAPQSVQLPLPRQLLIDRAERRRPRAGRRESSSPPAPRERVHGREPEKLPPEKLPPGALVPVPPSPLLGRAGDLGRLQGLVTAPDARLVTVVGPGGVGKTRLVMELARDLAAAAWVALAPLEHSDDVARAIARALSLAPEAGTSVLDALLEAVAVREFTLVLDNFEHVLGGAPLVAQLLAGARGLSVLVTSREPLRLRAERVFRLGPLELPRAGAHPEELASSPATALFVATAIAHDPELAFTGQDLAAAVDVCRNLDGLPLAIELAASRVGLLSPRELADQVRGGLDALVGGSRDAPERQRTLRDTLAWSHRLLDEEERAAFARFAVFVGGADLPAAQAVTEARLETLQALVTKHLLSSRLDRRGAHRLDMLQTVRQFAREQLARDADADESAQRHADFFLAVAENAGPELRRRAPRQLVDQLDDELHNLRAAMAWALEREHPERAIRLARALTAYWKLRNPGEGARWLRTGLERTAKLDRLLLTHALTALAQLLAAPSASVEAEATARQALVIARSTGDAVATAAALTELSHALMLQYREREAYPLALEAVELAAAADDPVVLAEARLAEVSAAPDTATALRAGRQAAELFEQAGNASKLSSLYSNLSYLALAKRDDETARQSIARAKLTADGAATEREMAWVLGNEGLVLLVTGDLASAKRAFHHQLDLARRYFVDEVIPEGLYGLAAVHAARGDDLLAARLEGAAQALEREPAHPHIRARLEQQFFAAARHRVGNAAWHAAMSAGRELGVGRALKLAGVDDEQTDSSAAEHAPSA